MKAKRSCRAVVPLAALAGGVASLGSGDPLLAPDTHLLLGGLVASPTTPEMPQVRVSVPASGSPHDDIRASIQASYPFDPSIHRGPTAPLPTFTPGATVMPKVVVHSKRYGSIDYESLLTAAALLALEMKKYPGAANRYQDPRVLEHGLPNYAVLMRNDEKRHKNMEEMDDMASLLDASGRPADAKELRELIQDTFIRHETPLEDAMDRSVNWGRR